MRTIDFILGCTAASLIACGGRTASDSKYGLEAPVGSEDVAYPTGDFGYVVGDVLPNVAFLGYEHLDPSTTIDTTATRLGTIRFSDFYDPTGEREVSFLYVSLQYVWCGVSNEQDDYTNGGNWTGSNNGTGSSIAEKYAKSVRFMTLLADGPTVGTDATPTDLLNWVNHHQARISEGLLEHDELAINVVAPDAPYNMIVDVRTMRVVDVEVGFDWGFSKLASLVSSRVRGMANH